MKTLNLVVPRTTPPRAMAHRGPCCALFISALSLLLVSSAANAQVISVTATVDQDTIAFGGRVTLTIDAVFNGQSRVGSGRPEGSDFVVVDQNQMQYTNSFNRNARTQFTCNFRLQPLREGDLMIGAVELQFGSFTHRTTPIPIRVTSPNAGPLNQNPRTEDPPNPIPTTADGVSPFIMATLSETQVFVGQQLGIDFEYFEPDFPNYDLINLSQPSFDDVWFEAISGDQIVDYRRREVRIGRRDFNSSLLARFLVVPVEIGTQEVGAFDGEVASRNGQQSIASEVHTFEVLPLPQGAPSGFSRNNVGDYSFAVEVEPGQNRVGDPIRVTLRVQGYGLVALVELPDVRIENASVQPPIERHEQQVSDGLIGGYRQLEYVVMPTQEGEFEIGAINFHYFDPLAGEYRTLESEPSIVTISGFNPNADMIIAHHEEEVAMQQSLGTPRPTTSRRSQSAPLPMPLFLGLAGFPFVVLFTRMVAKRARRRREASAPIRVKKSALSKASHTMKSASGTEGFSSVANGVRSYLRERFDIRASALTTSGVAEALRKLNVKDETADDVRDILQACEVARFAGGGGLEETDLKRRALAALKRLEAVR